MQVNFTGDRNTSGFTENKIYDYLMAVVTIFINGAFFSDY